MRKKATLVLGAAMVLSTIMPTLASPLKMASTRETYRVVSGTYYDYMSIVTEDGNEWLLGDDSGSRYLDNKGNAIFKDGESVLVLFNTLSTETVEDDIILNVYGM